MNIDTRTVHNFLTDTEIDELTNLIVKEDKSNIYQDIDPVDHLHIADTYHFNLYLDEFRRAYEILVPKIHAEFGNNVYIEQCHVLHSYHPYGIHTDTISVRPDYRLGEPSWTFIIPIEDVNSSTIVFNEKSADIKTVKDWINTHKIKPNSTPISDELYEKYFTHCDKLFMKFLTIEDIFLWRKGSLFAASREKFHVSDNYRAHNIDCKKAIIIWTSIVNK